MRARYPDCEGTVVRDGVEIRYERYGRGSGGSGRPLQPAAYTDAQFASDALAVMDA